MFRHFVLKLLLLLYVHYLEPWGHVSPNEVLYAYVGDAFDF